ncbi:MAG: phosphatidate cytidylyltransferase [Longimicrobiales bacterium]|nr:phosphatidate cytidylyltransferase [Longimicrobiales bacterium]
MSRPGDLVTRLGVVVLGIPVVLGALFLGGWVLGAMMATVAFVGALEFYKLRAMSGESPIAALGAPGAAAAVLLATAFPAVADFGGLALGLLLGLYAIGFVVALLLRWPADSPVGAASTTVSGVLYVGIPLAFVPILRSLPELRSDAIAEGVLPGMGFILLPLLVTWANDSAAYFTGHAFGRTRLAPSLSPGKTWEGAIGGLLGAAAAAVASSLWFLNEIPDLAVAPVQAALIGVGIGMAAQVGDLVESALKREAGAKDSGRVFPGHGGVLDRVDSLIWSFPFTWLMLEFVGVLR